MSPHRLRTHMVLPCQSLIGIHSRLILTPYLSPVHVCSFHMRSPLPAIRFCPYAKKPGELPINRQLSQNYFSFPPLHPPSLSYGTLLPSSRSFATRDRPYFALNSIHSLSIRTTTKSSSITAYGVPRSLLKFASPSFRGTPSSAYDVVY